MKEIDWLTSTTPTPMFQYIRSRVSGRKLQLLAVASCRLIAQYFDDPGLARLVDQVEQMAEGELPLEEWAEVLRLGEKYGMEGILAETSHQPAATRLAVRGLVSSPPASALDSVLRWSQICLAREAEAAARPSYLAGQRQQADLFREVIGNPFLERTLIPDWMTLSGSRIFAGRVIRISETARALAEGIHADRAFERMPILADALEESGCHDSDLLQHLREPGRHVLGCWALDFVLGKS